MDGPPTALPPTPCVLCGARDRARPMPELPWVARCERCGLVFADPQPSDAELESIYDQHYYEQFGFVEGPGSSDEALARTKKATYARMLARALPHVRSGGRRLLDVGCGLGFSLLAAKDAGMEATGLDPLGPMDPGARPGRTIVRGELESYVPEHAFDVISLIDVIEHVRNPVTTLRRASALLAPGGVLLLATNDSSSLGARLLGPRWTHYHRAHLWFFTPRTLREVTEKSGLDVLSTEGAERVYSLDYIASILARGTNFKAAATASKLALRVLPQAVLGRAWPPVPEGFLVIAKKPEPR